MKSLITLANACNKRSLCHGHVLFDGNAARSTDFTNHIVITGGWQFDTPTSVSVVQIKAALAINSKKPIWSGNTLNGVELTGNSNLQVSDWPEVPTPEFTRVDIPDLANTVSRLKHAMAKDDVRYFLKGLCLDFDNNALIACDGHRMAVKHDAMQSDRKGEVIIPIDALTLAGSKMLSVSISEKHCRIAYPGGYVVAPLVDGKFPDWKRVLPNISERLNRHDVTISMVQNAKVAFDIAKVHWGKFPRVEITPSGKLLTYGTTLDFLPGQSGIPVSFGVNAKYLHEALSSAGSGSEMRLSYENLDSLLIIAGDYQYVVVPMRI